MKPVVKITQTVDKTAMLRELMARLTDQDVYIGVPPEKDSRPDLPIGNAQLSYIHEHGSPRQNIPARPHLFPVIRSMRAFVIKKLERAWLLTLQGDQGAVQKALEAIGIVGRNLVRRRFLRNSWRPLSLRGQKERMNELIRDSETDSGMPKRELLLMRRTRKKMGATDVVRGVQQRRYTNPAMLEKMIQRHGFKFYPLHDTGRLMEAHDYVIRKREGKAGVFGVLTGGEAGGESHA